MAVKDEAAFTSWLQKWGAEKFFLGADVKEEKITISGWTKQTDIDIYEFIQQHLDKGITQLFCTDVAKDGALEGPSLHLYNSIVQKYPALHFVASGGVSGMKDVEKLKEIGCSGVIIGKAIYEGRIRVQDLGLLNSQSC
ncbi:MAG TPA: HisA/HisF-related TIM barrel protein, partial [Flavisolibacter sp.]|nr:HisA/HisF-related TIM barrel protein [Flavisolibacter sp.]